MSLERVVTIDLNFFGFPGAIASYLVHLPHQAVLIEPGPATTIPTLKQTLADLDLTPSDIRDVFITHIHLDHAGAAGWLAEQGATIHVHPKGAPHLINPEKLLQSASRIYGEFMDTLWGEFKPVSESNIHIPQDNERVSIDGFSFQVLDTPGHSNHHYSILFEGVLFSGDIGGIRVGNTPHIELPTPPPEFNPQTWRASLLRLQELELRAIAPTHFGIYTDVQYHLDHLLRQLDQLEEWLETQMSSNPSIEELSEALGQWLNAQGRSQLPQSYQPYFTYLNPTWMSAAGIYRYWHKVRQA
ncbi:MAG: MBL fold hydrolase [Anaerolineae bacterium]|jgi:glyoxylase-like metal-dependent hydrolase (beta-lactamase superfamily II)|nr:MAG: MBL fold hydrolase [Anaerolineae bacterium]